MAGPSTPGPSTPGPSTPGPGQPGSGRPRPGEPSAVEPGAGSSGPGKLWPAARTLLNAVNGTTLVGMGIAVLTGTKLRRGRGGILIAEGYRRKSPPATCFTIGSVIITRRTAEWLLDERRERLLAHESRHAGQYAVLGPLFWPAYWASCGYSWAMTGTYGTRNFFERHAGLEHGGYRVAPLRPGLRRLSRKA